MGSRRIAGRAFAGCALAFGISHCYAAETARPPGDLKHLDPVVALGAVQQYAGPGYALTRLTAAYVREDGTLDLTLEGSKATYHFVRPTPNAVDESRPVGARRLADPFETAEVNVTQPHWFSVEHVKGTSWKKSRGMSSTYGTSKSPITQVDAPCPFAKLWADARRQGAPEGAVATIRYDAAGYEFVIDGTSFRFRYDRTCNPRGDGAPPSGSPARSD